MPLTKLAAMAATFSLSVPVGIFIGVGVSLHTGDELSDAKIWTLGAFDGVSGACCLTRCGAAAAAAIAAAPKSACLRRLIAAWPVFAGGMLLYMTLITFIGEEFSRSDLHTPQLRGLKYQMWALLVLGAAMMSCRCWESGRERRGLG
jgi:zinc transporter ZupT